MRLTVLLLISALPALAPFDLRLAHCPVPYEPSHLARSLAHREGFGALWTLPRRLHNPCALRPLHYLKFPTDESGWKRCDAALSRMSKAQILDAWMLQGKTDPLSLKLIEEVHRMRVPESKWPGFLSAGLEQNRRAWPAPGSWDEYK
jgi:hypothetical protein